MCFLLPGTVSHFSRWHSCSEATITLTPTAGSNFSRYVIPDDTNPSGICCICVPVPDDRQWLAQFYGAIWRLSLQTHYERDAAHSGKIVAAKWREIWMEIQDMSCGCEPSITDISITTQINMTTQLYLFELKQLYIAAGLDIDIAFPLTPDSFDTDPGDVGSEITDRDRALCIAVEAWVNETFNRALAYIQGQQEEIAAVIAIGLAMPSISTKVVVGAFIVVGTVAGQIILELADDAYREYIACGIYNELKGKDTNSPPAFYAAADSLPARPPPPQSAIQDIARDLIETWLRSQLNNLENYLGFIDMLATAMTVAATVDDNFCSCKSITLILKEPIPPYSVQPVLEDLGGGNWRFTSGEYIRPDFGATDVILVEDDTGACFDIINATLISGSMSRTSGTFCAGGTTSLDNPNPQNINAILDYALQDIGQTDGFVVECAAIPG